MRIPSPIPRRRVRLEIIPLIDIMFFLLAAFMMVSLTMISVEALRMDLPTPVAASGPSRLIQLEVDALGDVRLRAPGDAGAARRVTLPDLLAFLSERAAGDPDVPVSIQGSPDASHGDVVRIVDLCRGAGIRHVSYDLSEPAD